MADVIKKKREPNDLRRKYNRIVEKLVRSGVFNSVEKIETTAKIEASLLPNKNRILMTLHRSGNSIEDQNKRIQFIEQVVRDYKNISMKEVAKNTFLIGEIVRYGYNADWKKPSEENVRNMIKRARMDYEMQKFVGKMAELKKDGEVPEEKRDDVSSVIRFFIREKNNSLEALQGYIEEVLKGREELAERKKRLDGIKENEDQGRINTDKEVEDLLENKL